MAGDFYTSLLGDAATRNNVDTAAKAQELIDSMEAEISHDELPPIYDWLVAKRNQLA